MNGSVYKGARLKWVEERKRQKEKPLLLRDLRVHEVANRRNEGVECKGVGENRRRSSLLLFQRIKNFIFHFFCPFIRIFFFSFLLVRVKRNPFYSGLWILSCLNENVHIYQERLCYCFRAIRIFYSLRITTAALFRHSSQISKNSVIPVSADRWQACFCTRLPSDVKLISPNAIRSTFIRVMPQQSGPVIRAKFFWVWRCQENRILK